MLQVPTLKPDQNPFDLNLTYPLHPSLSAGGHILSISPASLNAAPPTPDSVTADDNSDLMTLLDHTLVKEAITNLHIEDDQKSQNLLAYSHSQICDIVPDYLRFIKAQRDKYNTRLKTNRQRHLFATIAQAYFDRAQSRAQTLRDKRIRQFRRETIKRQNEEFFARALRPENIMDDHLQSQYRDMILHNIEFLLADASPDDREAALADAGRELYGAIIDARLSRDPASVAPLLDSSAVQRVFPGDVLAAYRTTMENAILRGELEVKAGEWVAREVAVSDAKRMAVEQYADTETRAMLLDMFSRAKINSFRKQCLQILFSAEMAWNDIKAKGYDMESPSRVIRNGDQALWDCIMRLLAARERRGGGPQVPEYCFVLGFIEEFTPESAAKSLARKEKAYELIEKSGGFESSLYAALVRLLLGKLTPADRNWFDCLLHARDWYIGKNGMSEESVPEKDGKINRFINNCDTVRRLRLQKHDCEEMDPVEMHEIVDRCLSAFDA